MKRIPLIVLLVCSFAAIAATPAFAAGGIGSACYAAGFTQPAAHGHIKLSQQIDWCKTQRHHIIDFHGSATTTATNGWSLTRMWHSTRYTYAGTVGHRYISKITRTVHASFVKHVGTTTYVRTLWVTQSTF